MVLKIKGILQKDTTKSTKLLKSFDAIALDSVKMKEVRVDPAQLPPLPKNLLLLPANLTTRARYDNGQPITGTLGKITITCQDYDTVLALQETEGERALDLATIMAINVAMPDEDSAIYPSVITAYNQKISEIEEALESDGACVLTDCELGACPKYKSLGTNGSTYKGLELKLFNFDKVGVDH